MPHQATGGRSNALKPGIQAAPNVEYEWPGHGFALGVCWCADDLLLRHRGHAELLVLTRIRSTVFNEVTAGVAFPAVLSKGSKMIVSKLIARGRLPPESLVRRRTVQPSRNFDAHSTNQASIRRRPMTNGDRDSSAAEESLRDLLIVLVIATLTTAIILEFVHIDASNAWSAFSGVLGFLVGLHVPKPQSAARIPFTRK